MGMRSSKTQSITSVNDSPPSPTLWDRVKRVVGPVLGLVLFCVAVSFLYRKSQEFTWQEFTAGVASIPIAYHVLAMLLVAINYVVLMGNDFLAVQYVGAGGQRSPEDSPLAGSHLNSARVALVSFLSYALGNSIGPVAAGVSLRVRFYGSWGLTSGQILAIIAFTSLSFWVGFFNVGGLMLSIVEVPLPKSINLPVSSRVLGYILVAVTIGYVAVCCWWRRSLVIGKMRLRPPGPRLMAKQIAVASTDLMLVSSALYVLLPAGIEASYMQVVAVYLLALASVMLTQVPGGLGVLEAILMSLLTGSETSAVMASLLVFRIYYYVLPMLVAAMMLAAVELRNMKRLY